MTVRQQVLRIVYPFWLFATRLMNKHSMTLSNDKNIPPLQPLYHITLDLINGKKVLLQEWMGKKILFVNTASDCGYTAQYKELQQLHEQYGDKLIVVGFPANDFKEQEKGSDDEIAQFCQLNFGITFPLAKKSVVVRHSYQHPVYQWLTSKEKNGWNEQQPNWNFSKYLVNDQGVLMHYFDASISPLDKRILKAIQQ